MSTLAAALKDYLATRRSFGFTMPHDGRQLAGFVEFCLQAGAENITTEVALAWARQPSGVHPATWGRRLGLVRGFARYLATIDPRTQVPPADVLPGHRPRVTPHIYTDGEIMALMAAAGRLTPALRAARMTTVIGLLATTGLRPAEALGLDRLDVDLNNGVVHVRVGGKRGRQRDIPLHPTTSQALATYARLRDAGFGAPSTPAFFLSARGQRMGRHEINKTFPVLLADAGVKNRGGRPRPRPYDLRHSFAVHTLIDWHRAGVDIDRKMPLLSTYMGHTDPASSYWYLEAVPELMQLVARRLEQLPGVL
jgi:integrase/recombinase XerD